jgi:hypothetical protein
MKNEKLKFSYGLGAYGKDAGCAIVLHIPNVPF